MDNQRLQSLFGLDGKRAVVTGGSRGIGLMIAEGLIDAGCEVIISARKAEQVADAAARLSEKGTCIGVPADLSTDEGIAHLGEAVAERCAGRGPTTAMIVLAAGEELLGRSLDRLYTAGAEDVWPLDQGWDVLIRRFRRGGVTGGSP